MNTAVVAKLARGAWDDLRQKRMWPVALALVVGMVAVPVLLLRSPASTPAPTPLAATGVTPSGIPAVSASTAPGHVNLSDKGRDPFTQPGGSPGSGGSGTVVVGSTSGTTATAGSAGGKGAAGAAGSATSTGAATGSGSTTSGGTAVSGPVPAGGAPPPPLPPNKPAPAPTGLSPLQSYGVSLSMTNASGGVDRIDQLARLALLPDANQPLLMELGVLQGGNRVAFAVPPGTVLHGPGTCVPGPIDCEILTLGIDQIEAISSSASSGASAMFAVTDISTVGYSSAAAAQQARNTVSAAGLKFLGQLSLPALSLFPYDPGAGTVADLRNLTVGG
jgi:hypothetical protein